MPCLKRQIFNTNTPVTVTTDMRPSEQSARHGAQNVGENSMNASSLSPSLPFTHFYFIPCQALDPESFLLRQYRISSGFVSVKGDIPFSWCVCHWAVKLIQGSSFETFGGNSRHAYPACHLLNLTYSLRAEWGCPSLRPSLRLNGGCPPKVVCFLRHALGLSC